MICTDNSSFEWLLYITAPEWEQGIMFSLNVHAMFR